MLLSLSLDLKRITQSIQRDSHENATRFSEEAKRWLEQAEGTNDEYLKDLLSKIKITLDLNNNQKKAEDCLMYSVLIKNQALAN